MDIKLEKKPWYIRYRYYLTGGYIVFIFISIIKNHSILFNEEIIILRQQLVTLKIIKCHATECVIQTPIVV